MPARRMLGPAALIVAIASLTLGALGGFDVLAAQDPTPTPAVTPAGGGATTAPDAAPTAPDAAPTAPASVIPNTAPASTPVPGSPEQAYLEWLQAHQARELTVVQAVPTSLDLASPGWRRDLALALDSWGALIQQARDQRPPSSTQAVHRALLDALDSLDRARRMLLVAAVTAQEPGPELAALVEQGRQGLARTGEQARALGEGRLPAGARPAGTRGNLRITVLGATRPYLERGAPAEPGFEYLNLRLRLESVAGEPVLYDAFHFRVRTADQTDHVPTPLGLADELLYGALEGNRLAGEIVGSLIFPVRAGVPLIGLFYAADPGDPPLIVPLGEPLPTVMPTPTARPGS